MIIRLENIDENELCWVKTKHDTYLVHENPNVLRTLLKWQFLSLPLIIKIDKDGSRVDWKEKKDKNVQYKLVKNYMASSLIKSIRPASKKELL